MDEYAGRVLADRYRLPLPPSDEYELVETRAFDTYSGQEVLVRQLPLPEVVDAEVLDGDGAAGRTPPRRTPGRATRRPTDPAVRRAMEAAQAAAQIPDHPRLDQVFDVFAEGGSLWIVSELVAARPLAALLAERPLSPYRAAEIGADVLTALRALHAHGWTHRNITARTVLVCDDGRVVLTGLAAGAAEEALCGYAPIPDPDLGPGPVAEDATPPESGQDPAYGTHPDDDEPGAGPLVPGARPEPAASPATADVRAARAGAIAAYRAGARAAARVDDAETSVLPPAPPPRAADGYDPQWWSQAAEDEDDETEYGPEYGSGGSEDDTPPRGGGTPRALLTGTWHDGPAGRDGSRPVPAGGGGRPALPAGYRPREVAPVAPAADVSWHSVSGGEALRADSQRRAAAPSPAPATGPGGWEEVVAGGPAPAPYRGPATPLAAERARQARIMVVGAVTERWAPEQAGPVHENWQLAPPIGPSTDLWALGALLYRAVQGHAPYPEENAAELVQLVCSEPPAFAEECGPLRPVVESLLRQDPTERPDFEELRGWLRSLVRSAPEPEAGTDVVPLPSADDTRLPIVRRRGELVRKRRGGAAAQGRHRHRKTKEPRQSRLPRQSRRPSVPRQSPGSHEPQGLGRGSAAYSRSEGYSRPENPGRPQAPGRTPRSLGRNLLLLILLLLAGAVAYAMLFMPKSGEQGGKDGTDGRTPAQQQPGAQPTAPANTTPGRPTTPSTATSPAAPVTGPPPAAGYILRKDTEGFQTAVGKDWRRSPINDAGQVRYNAGEFTLIVVPGRDTVQTDGADPMAYQRTKERELQPWRDSSWSSASGLRRIDVGQQAMAEGQFTWQDSSGREVFVRNLAMIVAGRYHVVQVIGPEGQRDKVSEIYQQATQHYRVTR
ncbi:protein kinase [Streptomyces purpureus]|uniref:protein kinase n=1 Tax=Streptomyces purpureus TaxID=1951 RepID=UPI00037D40B0|nr:protein kinase [Streptomyces purpureus]